MKWSVYQVVHPPTDSFIVYFEKLSEECDDQYAIIVVGEKWYVAEPGLLLQMITLVSESRPILISIDEVKHLPALKEALENTHSYSDKERNIYFQFTGPKLEQLEQFNEFIVYFSATRDSLRWPKNGDAWRRLEKTTIKPTNLIGAMTLADSQYAVEGLADDMLPNFCNKKRCYSAIISTGTMIGRCFGSYKQIVSNYHCIKKGDVAYTNKMPYAADKGATTFKWKDRVDDQQHDISNFGGFEFKDPEEDNLYAVVDLIKGITLYVLCISNRATVLNLEGTYSMFVPVEVDFRTRKVKTMAWSRKSGLSGSPIVSDNNEIVGIYGYSVNAKATSISHPGYAVISKPTTQLSAAERYFEQCVEQTINQSLTPGKSFYILEAPTGSGKTITYTTLLAIKTKKNIAVLEPTVASAINAFDGIRARIKFEEQEKEFTIEMFVGERNIDSAKACGKGAVKISVYTAGKFINTIETLINQYDYILVDEAHMRRDVSIIFAQLKLAETIKRLNASEKTIVYMTATDVGLDAYGQRLAIPTSALSTKHHIKTIYLDDNRNVPCSDTNFIKLKLSECHVKHPIWQSEFYVEKNAVKEGRTLVFVPTVRSSEVIAKQFKDQTAGIAVENYYAGCGKDISQFPKDVIICTTDALGVSVTVPDCRCVIDFITEIKPRRVFEPDLINKKYTYVCKIDTQLITQQSADQRKGRTGRTNPGIYMRPHAQLEQQQMWDLTCMMEVAFRFASDTQTINEYLATVRRLPFEDAVRMLEDYRHLHTSSELFHSGEQMRKRCRYALQAQGDQLGLYLMPAVSEEWLEVQQSEKDEDLPAHHLSVAVYNKTWAQSYYDSYDSFARHLHQNVTVNLVNQMVWFP